MILSWPPAGFWHHTTLLSNHFQPPSLSPAIYPQQQSSISSASAPSYHGFIPAATNNQLRYSFYSHIPAVSDPLLIFTSAGPPSSHCTLTIISGYLSLSQKLLYVPELEDLRNLQCLFYTGESDCTIAELFFVLLDH